MGKRSVEKERHWREVVARFERSGMKVRAFCEEQQIKEYQFFSWRCELRRRDRDQAASQDARGRDSHDQELRHDDACSNHIELPRPIGMLQGARDAGTQPADSNNSQPQRARTTGAFAPLHVVPTPSTSPSSIEIIVGDGRRVVVMPGFDPQALSQVLAVVEGRIC